MATLVPSGLSTFTLRTTPTLSYVSVASNGTIFVAVSYDGDTSPVLTSTDGTTWTQRAAGTANHAWNDVIWVPELALFVAVSDASGETTNVMTSPDGITWTARTAPDTAWIAVAWNGTTLVAVSYNNTDNVMTSTDGINWTAQTSSGIGSGLDDITWSPTLSLFVGVNIGGSIYSSANGIDWTLRATPTGASNRGRVIWNTTLASFFVPSNRLGGVGNGGVWASTDGVTWALQTLDVSVPTPTAIVNGPDDLLVVIDGTLPTTTIATSTDGVTWTLGTCASGRWYAATWDDTLGILAAVEEGGADTTGVQTATYNELPSVTGLDHLEGEAVSVWADGVVLASPYNTDHDTITVTSGTATLPAGTYTTVAVGLPYVRDIQTLDLDTASGTVKPGKFLVTAVGAYVEDSLGFFAGPEEPTTSTGLTLPGGGSMQEFQVLDRNDTVVTTPSSGYRMLNFEGRWDQSGSVFIRHLDPSPLTVLALVPYGATPR